MKMHRKDKTLYIVPECDLVASQVVKLRESILNKLKKEQSLEHIVLNVKDIDVVDSLGINLIIGIYRHGESLSISFEIVNASEKFIKISNFFKFEDFFNVSPEKKAK